MNIKRRVALGLGTALLAVSAQATTFNISVDGAYKGKIDALSGTDSALQFYDSTVHNSTNFVELDSANLFLYEETDTGELSLFSVFRNDGTSAWDYVDWTLSVTGGSPTLVESDDDGEFTKSGNVFTGDWRFYNGFTDGGVIGSVEDAASIAITNQTTQTTVSNLFALSGTSDNLIDLGASGFQNIELSPVPLPAAAWLFGTALLGFAGAKRARRRVRA